MDIVRLLVRLSILAVFSLSAIVVMTTLFGAQMRFDRQAEIEIRGLDALSSAPAQIVTVAAGDTAYAQRLGDLPDAALVTAPAVVGDGTWRIDVYSDAPSLDESTQGLVAAVRATEAPYPTLVGGVSARAFSMAKSCSVARTRMAVTLTPACMSFLAYSSPSSRRMSFSSTMISVRRPALRGVNAPSLNKR